MGAIFYIPIECEQVQKWTPKKSFTEQKIKDSDGKFNEPKYSSVICGTSQYYSENCTN